MSRRLASLAALLVLAGCTPRAALVGTAALAPGGVALAADRTAYGRGDSVRLTLTNGATATATTGVLECARIETWSGTAWGESSVGNDRACILIARMLAPGETMTGDVVLDVPAGTYRLAQSVTLDGAEAGVTAATAAFRVGG